MKFLKLFILVFCVGLLFRASAVFAELNLDKLSDEDILKVKNLIIKLTPLIQSREKIKNLAKLTFAELYAPLNEEERALIQSFRNLDAKELGVRIPYQQIATGQEELDTITGQRVWLRVKNNEGKWEKKLIELPPQFLPPEVHEAFLRMMEAMESDIAKRLYIDSGYRSSAYQLYLFIYYLQNHEYSIRETVKWVALPGYSEHGAPKNQAIDFININGVSGEDDPQKFEALEEYEWLLQNAERFGFVLSYPRKAKAGITFEPWHWRYDKTLKESQEDN